ncbi:MAG: ASCH domain-containing protein, partial [Mycoplasmataceae bacterium]|nr:ASCH domain-containing protein [Mycoplasmataceae bacterium]
MACNNSLNLPVKKKYFDAIVNGTKKIEIRCASHLAGPRRLCCVETNETVWVELGLPNELLRTDIINFAKNEPWWDEFCFSYTSF